jgi:Sulfotransferase domain
VRRIFRTRKRLPDPVLICDEPEEGSVVTRGTVVSGWAYSPAGIREVSLWLEGQRVGRAELGLERENVARAHPEWAGALRSGFRYRFEELPFSKLAQETDLVVVAEDALGRRAEVRIVVSCDLRRMLEEKLKDKKWAFRKLRNQERREKNDRALAEKAGTSLVEHRTRKKRLQQEIFELERELRAVEEGRALSEEPLTGALPDFVIIGAQKGGTTSLYHLLTQHPLVEPCAKKELHFFDIVFGQESVEWYKRCFPTPSWQDGQRTITGEATPYYLFHPRVPERVAQVIPQARFIALLRNPVDRAYSHHRQEVTKGNEILGFEEAIEAEKARLGGERAEMLQVERYFSVDHQRYSYLSRGIYVDQLLRWSEFFSEKQILVLKSEDFFERPKESLKLVLDFLGLPEWEPAAWEVRRKGEYERQMDPSTRRRLEEYFEPHNKRLYEFLGKDFGW